jgi:outer membrane lipoprotein carrier protein
MRMGEIGLGAFGLGCLLAMGALAAPAPSPAPAPSTAPVKTLLPKLLQEVEAKYSKAHTLTAGFSQVVESVVTKQRQTSSGIVMFKRPNKIRWETLKPDPNLFVCNGVHAWYYTPPFEEGERGEYRERNASEVQTKLANGLLSGSFSVASDMRIEQKTPVRFLLRPKKEAAGTVEKAEIDIDPQEQLIRKVIIQHRGGNRTEVSLSDIELGKELPDSDFYFSPPRNTDRVED